MKQYQAYKPSGVEWLGEIPSEWECKDLKRLTRFAYGDSLSDENRNGGEIPVYGSNGIVGFHDTPITSAPCIVVGRKGSFGKINFSDKPCFPIDTSYFIDNTQTKCDLKWLSYYLSVLKLDGNTLDDTVPGLSREWAYRMPGLIITIPEQQAIVHYLDYKTALIDNFIANRQQQIELLKEQKSAIVNKAVTKGINPNAKMKDSGIEWIGEIPEEWDTRRLKFLSSSSLTNGVFKKSLYFGRGTKLVNVSDIYNLGSYIINFDQLERVDVDDNEKSVYSAISGDIFFVRSSLKEEGICASACIINPEENAVFECHLIRFRPDQTKVLSKFLIYQLTSALYRQREISLSQTTTMTTISQPKLASIEILVPSITEQYEIIQYMDCETARIDTLITKYQKQIDLMQEYRTALISQAVTGKIDVREWKPKQKGASE